MYYVLWYCENSMLKLNNEVFGYILFWYVIFLEDFIFLRWTIFKVFIEIVTVLFLLYVLVFWPRGMQVLNSLIRNWICTPCIGSQSFNHWTTREVFAYILLYLLIIKKMYIFVKSLKMWACTFLIPNTRHLITPLPSPTSTPGETGREEQRPLAVCLQCFCWCSQWS